MTFSLPGFDQWSFQIVMFGSLLVLEALCADQKLRHRAGTDGFHAGTHP